VLISVVLCLTACGYKTSPRPASATIPERILLVTARAFPDRIELTWDVPRTNTDGSPLEDLSGFKVFRSESEIGSDCKDCDKTKKLYANVDAQAPSNATIEGGNVVFLDKKATPGKVYHYAIAPYNFKGTDGASSSTISVIFDEPPPSPKDLKALADERGVVLEWKVSPRTLGIRSYRIYRSDTGNEEDLKPYDTTKWAEKFFVDSKVERNHEYAYQVRSVKMNEGIPMESRPSRTVRVSVPAAAIRPPEDINVISTTKGIRIFWKPVTMRNSEIGYDIYRSASGGPFRKINEKPLTEPSYDDQEVKIGTVYRYAVTAFPADDPSVRSNRSASEAVKHVH
jgi:fibronectin type 3 domain-containing protein